MNLSSIEITAVMDKCCVTKPVNNGRKLVEDSLLEVIHKKEAHKKNRRKVRRFI